MKFVLKKASDSKYEDLIEINTLEDLMKLIEKEDEDIIINKDYEIMIYDFYIE